VRAPEGPLPQETTTEAASPERRAFLYALAASDLLFLAADLARRWPRPALVAAGRVALAVVLAGAAVLLGRLRSPAAARRVTQVGGVACALGVAVVAWGSGGSESFYLPLLPLTPLILFIAVPDVPSAVLLAGAAAAAAGLGLLVAEGVPAARVAVWALAYASGTAYALVGSAFHLRTRARAAAAIAGLEASERRRARSERLTLAGRLAAGVAHGVNNPLSAALASTGFLERALRERAAPDDAELRDAAAEARASQERIRRLVQDLSSLAREPPDEEPGPCPVATLLDEAARIAAVRGVVVAARELRPPLPPALVRRARVTQLVAGLLVSVAEAARAESVAPCAVRVAAAAEDGTIALRLEPLPPARGDRRALEDDLLVVLAREQLEEAGIVVAVTDAPGGAPALGLTLPAAPAAAARA
jgi:signal transduction histidine kinase